MVDRTARIERLLGDGDNARRYPGAVWAVGDASGIEIRGQVGLLDPAQPDRPMRLDTIFDVASLTKILAVWASIGALHASIDLPLDTPLEALWREAAGTPAGQLTVRDLLTHTAGQPLRANLRHLYGTRPDDIRAGVLGEQLRWTPGAAVEYTDRVALILGYLAEHLSGRRLDQLAAEQVWRPLGMRSTRFGPLPADLIPRCAPTEFDPETGVHVRGTVHDYSARLLGGVCGVAGVFSTAEDLGLFLQHLLDRGDAEPGFDRQWVSESMTIQTGRLEPSIGLLWQQAPRTDPADDIWVHYGFTGTAMWISPKLDTWAVLLTNKLYYTRDREPLMDIRDQFRALAFS